MNAPQTRSTANSLGHAGTASGAARRAGWILLAVLLSGVVIYAALHEVRKAPAPVTEAPGVQAEAGHVGHGMGHVERPPMSADEERYAHALWQIHDQVRSAAVKMTFAGLAYKMGDSDKAGMRGKVLPLIAVFDAARAKAQALRAPGSLDGLHQDYLKAVSLYQTAAREMTASKAAGDGHLLTAHEKSEQASTLLLKVGESLWPGEYKPN